MPTAVSRSGTTALTLSFAALTLDFTASFVSVDVLAHAGADAGGRC